MPESYPVCERIAQLVEARLKDVLREEGFRTTVSEVVRPTRVGNFTPQDKQVLLTQTLTRNDEHDTEGNPHTYGWDLNFVITLVLSPSDRDLTPIDQYENIFSADVMQALATHESWPDWDGLAVNSKLDSPETFGTEDGGMAIVTVPLIVTYRTPFNDPYTAA